MVPILLDSNELPMRWWLRVSRDIDTGVKNSVARETTSSRQSGPLHGIVSFIVLVTAIVIAEQS